MRQTALRRLWVLMATVFVDMVGVLMVLPLLPYYAKEYQASGIAIGLMTSIFAGAQLLSAPFWGRLSDRYGRRPVILAGLLASAGGYLFFGFAEALWMLFATRLLQGVGAGIIGVIQAYVSDTVPPLERTKALGWLTAAASAGVALGPVVGSTLSDQFGRSAPGLFAAAFCILNVIFAWRLLKESSSGGDAAEGPERRSLGRAVTDVLRHPAAPVSLLILLYALGMMAFLAMNAILGLFLMERFGVTEDKIGWFYTYVGGLSLMIRAFLLGPMLDRLGETRAMRIGAALMATGFLSMPLVPSIVPFLICAAFIPFGTALFFPTTTSMVSQHAPQREVGQMFGVQQAFRGVSGIVGPAWAGFAYDTLGQGSPFLVSAVFMAGAALCALLMNTGQETPEAANRQRLPGP